MSIANRLKSGLDTVFTLMKLLLLFRKGVKVKAVKRSESVLILGNGPSLKKELPEIRKNRSNVSLFAVNYFAVTEEFKELKPEGYVICSTQYWIEDKNKDWHADRMKVFESLVQRVEWPLDLFVPVKARSHPSWVEYMSKNPFITLNYFSLSPLDSNPKTFNFVLSRYQASPRPHNVLIPSILIAINLKYKSIYLAGADHSWLPEISVSTNNEVLIGQKHFYTDQFKNGSTLLKDDPKPMYFEGGRKTRKLHEVLIKFYYSFKAYWFLKEYAELKESKIYNLTSTSFIDAFEKIPINEFSITSKKA